MGTGRGEERQVSLHSAFSSVPVEGRESSPPCPENFADKYASSFLTSEKSCTFPSRKREPVPEAVRTAALRFAKVLVLAVERG